MRASSSELRFLSWLLLASVAVAEERSGIVSVEETGMTGFAVHEDRRKAAVATDRINRIKGMCL